MQYESKYGVLKIYTQNEYTGRTIRDFLTDLHIGKKTCRQLFQHKHILLNHMPVEDENMRLSSNACILFHTPPAGIDVAASKTPCTVVYEDDFVYVAHKPAGLILHDEDPHTETLSTQAAAWQLINDIHQPVRFIHRLDKLTTGLVLFVKAPLLQPWFDAMLQKREIQRTYLAICCGHSHVNQHFTYRQMIGRDRHESGKYRFSSTGKEALTKAIVLSRKGNYELIRCHPETGRTHQIRVHLAGNQHPIVNDPLYGIPARPFLNMGLWAYQIVWKNPLTHALCTATDFPNPDYAFFDSSSFH